MTERQSRPWYKHWWGVIIAIFIWPFFLWWFIWAKSGKRVAVKIGATVVVWVACVVALIALAAAAPATPSSPTATVQKPAAKPKTTSTTQMSTTRPAPATTSTSSPSNQTSTVSIATLNAQAVSLFNPVLADFEQQMAQGQSDAAQLGAYDVSSDFHSWETEERDSKNVANNNEVTAAYNKADNAYYDAHQTVPAALDNWDTDAGNLPGDISGWADAEQSLLIDKLTANNETQLSDDQAAAKALQQYKTDLAKAQADIAQL